MLCADAATLVRLLRGHLRLQGENRTTGNLTSCCLSFWLLFITKPQGRPKTAAPSAQPPALSFCWTWPCTYHVGTCLSSPHGTPRRHTEHAKQKYSGLPCFTERAIQKPSGFICFIKELAGKLPVKPAFFSDWQDRLHVLIG